MNYLAYFSANLTAKSNQHYFKFAVAIMPENVVADSGDQVTHRTARLHHYRLAAAVDCSKIASKSTTRLSHGFNVPL